MGRTDFKTTTFAGGLSAGNREKWESSKKDQYYFCGYKWVGKAKIEKRRTISRNRESAAVQDENR